MAIEDLLGQALGMGSEEDPKKKSLIDQYAEETARHAASQKGIQGYDQSIITSYGGNSIPRNLVENSDIMKSQEAKKQKAFDDLENRRVKGRASTMLASPADVEDPVGLARRRLAPV